MAWRGLETDLTLDPAATDVLAAYEAAWKARKSTAECYRAGFGRGARLTRIKSRLTLRSAPWR
jgi:hypothetical protein